MADFTTANLPGSNEKFNTIRNKFTSLKTSLKSNMAVDASSLVSTLQSDLSSFGNDFKKIIPELPDLPDLSLQAELESFAKLSGESAAQALASIKSRFGDGVRDFDFDLDELVTQAKAAIAKGQSIASKIPNITIPEAGGIAKLLPNNVKQADIETIEELLSEDINQEVVDELIDVAEKNREIELQSMIEKLKQVSLKPTGYIKKDTNTFLSDDEIEEIQQGLEKLTRESFQSTSVETTTGGGFTTTYEDGTVVRTAEDGTETVISGPTA